MKKKTLFLSIIFSIMFVLCCGFLLPNNIGTVYASSSELTDKYSFTSGKQSEKSYNGATQDFQDTNKLCSSNCISIKYYTREKSTNEKYIYEKVNSVSVKINSLGNWTALGNHWYDSGSIIVRIYKDGEYKEEKSTSISEGGSATIDLSSISYDCYTFTVECRYIVKWSYLWNSGSKYIQYSSSDFYCQTKQPIASLTRAVYDTTNHCYTTTIVPNGNYKTDNKDLYFRWNLTNYDNTTDTVNVYGKIYNKTTNQVVANYDEKKDGQAGYYLGQLNNGEYILEAYTKLGKSCKYYLTFEAFDPLLTITNGVRIDSGVYCIEHESSVTWTDTASVKSVKLNGFDVSNGAIIKPGSFNINWGIEYNIIVTRTTDATETYTFVFTNSEQVDLNANQNSFTKSPISRWYETYLLDTEEKTYNSWASYNNALDFAIQRENNSVTTAYYDGGTWIAGIGMDDPINQKKGYYFIYKQRNNASEMSAYFTREALDSSILAYAKASVSNNTYYSKSTPSTPHECEKVFKTKIVNDKEYNYYLLGSFTISKRPYVDLWINGIKQDFGAENTITINTAGAYQIDEINPFGDTATYFIHIQKSAPEIQYTIKGSSLKNILTTENTRFGNYFDLTLFDIDDDSLLIIEKSGIGSVSTVYTYSELFEILNQNKLQGTEFLFDTSGQYTVTSINHWTAFAHIIPKTYTFYVSVNEPFINEPSVNREKNELTLSYGIPVGEYNTQITSVVIRKYNETDDTWTSLTQDSKGTLISTACDTYIFNTKGYYVIQITDNFARTYEREYAFSREKPTAIFTVGNQTVELEEDKIGSYNKKVTITWYDNTITAKMYGVSYTWSDNVMVKQNLNAIDYTNGTAILSEGYYIVELMDIDYNSRRFTFFIDQKAPELVMTANDKEIASESYKNSDITAIYKTPSEYESPISISVLKDSFPVAYPENGIFTEEGSYELTLIDGAGNSNSYRFTIDKTAPEGQLYLEDGTEFAQNGITNKKVYCNWGESGITATCNDVVYYKGSLLSKNDNYKIVLTDKAGNTSIFTFQINSNIPIIVMKTESGKVIANNTTVDEAFTISWEDPNYTYSIAIIKNREAVPFTNYSELSSKVFKFEESGSYRFTFTNGIGVSYIYSVNANMKPTVIMTAGVDTLKSYDYTNKNVLLTISDRNANIEVYKLDAFNEYKTYSNWTLDNFTFIITEDGTYKIIIVNDFDLMNNYYFSIKTSLPTASITFEGNEVKASDEILGTVDIAYNTDEVVEAKLYRNGEIVYGDNSSVSEVGRYTLFLTDKAGNQNSYTFTIVASNDLNWAGIVTLVALCIGVLVVAIFLITKFRRPFKLK